MKRINIAIIDNNLIQRNETFEIVESYIRQTPMRASIHEFDSGSELIRDVLQRGRYDIYIMEVMLPDMNGILLAERLRTIGDRGLIIYLSKNEKDAYQAFQVRASDYILKSRIRERLERALDEVLTELIEKRISPVVEIKFKAGIMRVPVDSITYVDSVDRALCFHLKNGEILRTKCVRGTFREAVEQFAEHLLNMSDFVFAGKSNLLNVSYIMTLGKGAVLLKTGECIYIPRSAEDKLHKAWEKYIL